jgi:hypothetical protein
LGAATSGAVLFRSIGGAVGVALFGAIFSHALQLQLTHVAPADAAALASPSMIRRIPDALRADVVNAFSGALHLVFLIAAFFAAFAFVLSFFLREVPLRRTLATMTRRPDHARD